MMLARLKFALLVALGLGLLGAALAAGGWVLRNNARTAQTQAQAQRDQAQARFAQASDEAREIATYLPRYQALTSMRFFNAGNASTSAATAIQVEPRLLWADRIGKIGETFAVPGFRFSFEPLRSLGGGEGADANDKLFDAAPLQIRASKLALEFEALHEAEFLQVLAAVTARDGSVIPQVRNCTLGKSSRTLQETNAPTVTRNETGGMPRSVPLLAVNCAIEWLTLHVPASSAVEAQAAPSTTPPATSGKPAP